MKLIFTKHALLKLSIYKAHKINIKRIDIKRIFNKKDVIRVEEQLVSRVSDKLDENHSLVVVYKMVGKKIAVITFWPAKKGRYESKIQ